MRSTRSDITTCHIGIFLICILQIQYNVASVSREGLREEHLLPVRIPRGALGTGLEGSGDDDTVSPIRELSSRVMERMTLDDSENKIGEDDAKSKETIEVQAEEEEEAGGKSKETVVEDGKSKEDAAEDTGKSKEDAAEDTGKSKETLEDTDEGSGLDEVKPRTAAIVIATESTTEVATEQVADAATTTLATPTEKVETTTEVVTKTETNVTSPATTTTMKEEETTTAAPEARAVTEIDLFKSDPSVTTTEPETTTIKEVITTLKEDLMSTREDTTTVKEVTTTILPETGETIKPEVEFEVVTVAEESDEKAAAATTTTTALPDEREEVTEVVQVKHVQPAFASVNDITTEVATTTTRAQTTIPTLPPAQDNDTVLLENEKITTDTLLMKIKSRLLDPSESVGAASNDPSRLGTYIVVSLILLSFLSLVGFVLMRRRVQKRRKKSNMDPEVLETEKALLSLSEYKDHPDDEGKIKNNEITPIVIKSNTQINKFEKNTNFSSPKNLNTKANEKNVEKDNVLKRTSENLTQVIIEDPSKEAGDEEKASAEKLIVRTHLDQDSIPKKPVIVNRTSLGCVPVTQD